MHECRVSEVALDASITAALADTDCGSPRDRTHHARLYGFSGAAGDSVSIVLDATGFAGRLVFDTTVTDTCLGAAGDPCLVYQLLPRDGDYVVEVSTTAPGATGSFVLDLHRPRPPETPSGLQQLRGDSAGAIGIGATTTATAVEFRATVADPDPADELRLEVEVQPVSTAFKGSPSATSSPVSSGATASVRVSGLSANTDYHWRARTVDETGRAGSWAPYGDNPESAVDFRVSAPAATRLVFSVQPGTTAAGAPINPAVEVRAVDAEGNTDPAFTGDITMALGANPGGGALSGTKTVPADSGVARFRDLSIERAAAGYTLIASAAGLSGATSESFTIEPGRATRLAFTVQPSDAGVNKLITPPVEVTAFDAFGNRATGFTGTVTVEIDSDASPLRNARLSGTTTVPAVGGVAVFGDLRIDQPGIGYTLRASGSGVSIVSRAFTILI